MIDLKSPEISFVLSAVRRSAKIAQAVRREMLHGTVTKSDRSPVTVGDFAIQAILAHDLSRAFPKDSLIGEESSAILKSAQGKETLAKVEQFVSRMIPGANAVQVCDWIDRGTAQPADRFWTLDPIDGTKGFLRGGQYVVALALIVRGTVELGVLGCPNLNQLDPVAEGEPGTIIVAQRGKGTWASSLAENSDWRQLHVSSCKDRSRARIIQSVESDHTDVKIMNDVMCHLNLKHQPILMDSQAKHAMVAAGAAEFLYYLISPDEPHRKIKIWDQAPGAIIVEEAGGKITDLDGKPLDFGAGVSLARNRGVLATNGLLHRLALDALHILE